MAAADLGIARLGRYPQRRARSGSTAPGHASPAFALRAAGPKPLRPRRFLKLARRHEAALVQLEPQELAREIARTAASLRGRTVPLDDVARAIACVSVAVRSTLGFSAHDVQLLGAWHMLQGCLVEMETGEGKTLVAVFVAALHGLAGRSTHVITTNDYLAMRDAETMGPVYRALGLSVGCVMGDMPDADRRQAYRARIVYVTPKQVMFDYLRDGIRLGGRSASRLRSELAVQTSRALGGDGYYLEGLQVAVVDEADSVFVDEAVVPLIISKKGGVPDLEAVARTALSLAARLQQGRDFELLPRGRDLWLTPAGEALLAELGTAFGGVFANALWREQYVVQALMAVHLFLNGRDYIIRDGAVEIVDINTGRTMKDRSWERGLHQMIEAKENLAVTAPNESVARTSHQSFFRRYLMLCGMSGTLTEVRSELKTIYGLAVVRIPTNRPSQRRALPVTIAATYAGKIEKVAARVAAVSATGRPVLIGTRTVTDSERVSEALDRYGVIHRVLNARQDESEAAVIAAAGGRGAVTVATNMAGRGTDIKLEEGVAELGGLHVIATERHESRRIDRQLFGRAARQGDPGSYEEVLSLEDDIVRRFTPPMLAALARSTRLTKVCDRIITLAQSRAARRGHALRLDLAVFERRSAELLAFAGAGMGGSTLSDPG